MRIFIQPIEGSLHYPFKLSTGGSLFDWNNIHAVSYEKGSESHIKNAIVQNLQNRHVEIYDKRLLIPASIFNKYFWFHANSLPTSFKKTPSDETQFLKMAKKHPEKIVPSTIELEFIKTLSNYKTGNLPKNRPKIALCMWFF